MAQADVKPEFASAGGGGAAGAGGDIELTEATVVHDDDSSDDEHHDVQAVEADSDLEFGGFGGISTRAPVPTRSALHGEGAPDGGNGGGGGGALPQEVVKVKETDQQVGVL